MKVEIDINESAIIESVLSEIDSGMIEASILGHLENTNFAEYIECDFESEVEPIIDNFIQNMDFEDYFDVNENIDTDDIRYSIEDEILEQVNDHLDYDTIKYNIEDDIVDSCWSNFDIDDILDYDIIKESLEYDELQERVEALENQLEELQANPPRNVGLIRRILGWLW